jgi:RNA polymerase sigma-70 factor (ECF subfamily)
MEARLSTVGRRDHATVAVGGSAARELDPAAAVFVGVRPRLFEIAYRILASASESEDVVQEAWLRWQRTDRSVVLNPTAFLATTTTRLALNLVQSARNRRETYADPCILDPADPGIGPETRAERGEAVERAVLLLLQKLTPTERAAYVLREAFDYPYRQIAEILLLTSAHARQLVRRAHKRIASERRRSVIPSAHRRLVLAFRAASHAGQLSDLEQLLVADVASYPERTAGAAHPFSLRQSSGREQTRRPTRVSPISSQA